MPDKILIIRNGQMDVFKKDEIKKFTIKAADQMLELFPDISTVLGKEKLNKKITFAINNAKKYKIFDEKNLLRYISLTFILGDKFDNNSDYKRIHHILNDPNIKDSSKKIDEILSIIELSS
ncbi:hypothetical protein MHK_004052 [Candidatus Magnetomorum sp. HK-1]|nr:hypothetical protein MHK_004052 [Candidatus Magnetomorum sp. HK-1]